MFKPAIFFEYLLSPIFLAAAVNTLWISLAALVLGVVVGLILAVGQEARWRPARAMVTAYLWLFRGTPVLLQRRAGAVRQIRRAVERGRGGRTPEGRAGRS